MERGRPSFGSAIPVVLLNDTRIDCHQGCSRVMATLEYLLARIGCQVIATVPSRSPWRNDALILQALDRARLVVVNGEGTIHHDRSEGYSLLEVGACAKSRGVPAVLLNCTWQSNGSRFVEKLADFTRVAVRDSRSLREIQQFGIDCAMAPDLSLYLEYNSQSNRKGVGFTDSVDRPTSVELEVARSQYGGQYIPIQFSQAGWRGAYRFFRGYFGKQDLAHPLLAGRLLRLRLRQFRQQVNSDERFLDLVAALELLISGRFHACTMALLAGTPFVAAKTNTDKISALIEDAGLSAWRAAMPLSVEALHEARRIGWEPHESSAMADFLADARRRTDALFADIKGLL